MFDVLSRAGRFLDEPLDLVRVLAGGALTEVSMSALEVVLGALPVCALALVARR